MFELGKKYTTEEFKSILGVGRKTWDGRREELLEHCKDYFDFKVVSEGRYKYYIITKIIADYEPLPRRSKTAEKNSFYSEKVETIIKQQPLNTGSNIGRIIVKEDNKFGHKEGTAAKRSRDVLRKDYQKITLKWCFLDKVNNIYQPLNEEELEYLFEGFKNHKSSENKEMFIEKLMGFVDAYFNDEITEDTFQDQCKLQMFTAYEYAMERFIKKYGRRPMCVPIYKKTNDIIEQAI